MILLKLEILRFEKIKKFKKSQGVWVLYEHLKFSLIFALFHEEYFVIDFDTM
jgi:hypothetical protein